MITTSFARFYDDDTEMSAPLGWASATPAAAQDNGPDADDMVDGPAPRTGSLSQKFDAETRRHNGATEDGQLGEVILDSLFSMIFPGLAGIFSPLSTMDAVDLYDKTRDAFRRSAGQNPSVRAALPRYAQAFGPATRKAPAARRAGLTPHRPMMGRVTRHASPALMIG